MPYTKKQLMEEFSLGKSALNEHLRDCGLDSSKRDAYTDDEINHVFRVAETLRNEQGYSSRDVRRHFNVPEPDARGRHNTTQRPPTPPQSPTSPPYMDTSSEVSEASQQFIIGYVENEIEAQMDKAVAFFPLIVEQAFIRKIRSGQLHQAFLDYEENVRKPARERYNQATSYTVPYGGLGAARNETDEQEDDVIDVEEEIQEEDK